jgi:hypothetical protein
MKIFFLLLPGGLTVSVLVTMEGVREFETLLLAGWVQPHGLIKQGNAL